ncbi:MAG TPA: hypothetical protein VGO09_08160, partial [Flavisolibacter sp.]|nr:hypothetical protein [Flavisolibacter sp.]
VVLSNGKFNVANSFNQFGISPHYKWLTVHAGYRQMSFSEFTLNNQTFLGGGIEANPGKIRLAAMIGRFAKAVEYDTAAFGKIVPGSYPVDAQYINGYNYYNRQASYSRVGYALKLGYGTSDNFFDLMLFKAFDKTSSLKDTVSTNRVLPEANVVIGFNTFQRLSGHFNFSINAATSIYTYNTSAEDTIPLQFDKTVKGFIETFIKLRSTTQFQVAGAANFGWVYPNFSMQAQYQIIQPYYRSMGITSFLTDLQSLTLSPSFNFLRHKLQFSSSFQTQHDNLNKYKVYTTSRNLVNSTLSFNPNNYFGIDLMYSGFDLSQKKIQQKASDSTRLAQQSNTVTVMPRLMFQRRSFSDIISIAISYTNINNKVSVNDPVKTTNFYTTLTNVISLAPSGWSFTTGLNYNNAKSSGIQLVSSGFVAGISRGLLKNRLTLSNNTTLLFNKNNGATIGKTFSTDVEMNVEMGRRHHFSIGGNYTESPANGIYNQTDFSLYRFELGYQYRL